MQQGSLLSPAIFDDNDVWSHDGWDVHAAHLGAYASFSLYTKPILSSTTVVVVRGGAKGVPNASRVTVCVLRLAARAYTVE